MDTDLLVVKRNQVEMIQTRGYDTEDESDHLADLETFLAYYTPKAEDQQVTLREILTRIYRHTTDPEKNILVFYAPHPPKRSKLVSVAAATSFIALCEEHDVSDAIFLSPAELSPKARSDVEVAVRRNIQIFYDYELMYNPIKHILVPRQELVPPEEAQELLRRLRARSQQLPVIYDADPIVRYHAWPVGGIVRVYRDNIFVNTLTQDQIFYRFIVKK
jgi:DNA-directed RNA polymerase subunit H (RpoH/RPB5)